jgi:hypothetical protein
MMGDDFLSFLSPAILSGPFLYGFSYAFTTCSYL